MQKPDIVLANLAKQSLKENYQHDNIYRYLYNIDFYLMAYNKIYAKQGNMTPGTDGETIDGFSVEKVEKVIESLKTLKYQPKPARRVLIPKKNGKTRPLGIPSFQDKLVQEVIRMILEAIYEGNFDENSHGFRPNKSCKTVLTKIKQECTGMKWWVEGDIKGFFDNIDHHTLIALLRKKIKDERFINLIWKFLKAGYCEDWKFNNTYSGTPQGGIISPILSNIYLNELDKFMSKKCNEFINGKNRKRNAKHRQLEYLISKCRKEIDTLEVKSPERKLKVKEFKKLQNEMKKVPSKVAMDEDFKRMKYYRYADDFVVGIIGSKEDAENIKKEITNFLEEELKLELSQEKTLITNAKEKIRFLGYNVMISTRSTPKKAESGKWTEATAGKIRLDVPHEVIRDFLLDKKAVKIHENGVWEPFHRVNLTGYSDLEILTIYNAEIRGLYNYYDIATNVYKLDGMHHIMQYSYLKTLACKHRTGGVAKMLRKYAKDYKLNGVIGVWYNTNKGKKFREFYNDGFRRKETLNLSELDNMVDNVPNTRMYKGRTEIEQRLLANECEHCGTTEGKMEVHHVRKLADLKGKALWEKEMIARRRKTKVLCVECHRKLHKGELD